MACQVQSEALPSFASLAAEPAVEGMVEHPDATVATTFGSLSKPLVVLNGDMAALSAPLRHWSALLLEPGELRSRVVSAYFYFFRGREGPRGCGSYEHVASRRVGARRPGGGGWS